VGSVEVVVGDDNDPLRKTAAGTNATKMEKTGKVPEASNHNLRGGQGKEYLYKEERMRNRGRQGVGGFSGGAVG
jgi:hypothetical protein